MDGKLVVRKAIFRLRRRDARFCAGVVLFTTRYTTYLFASIVTSMSNIFSLHVSFRVRGLVGRLGFRVGVSVRFSVSVGVSVVDGK